MRSYFIYLLWAIAATSITAATPPSVRAHGLIPRAELCAGIDMRSKTGLANNNPIDGGDCTRGSTTPVDPNGNGVRGGNGFNAQYVYAPTPSKKYPDPNKITKDTNPGTAVVTARDRSSRVPPAINMYGGQTCDHILEINVLLSVLKQGVCDYATSDEYSQQVSYTYQPLSGANWTVQVTEGQKRVLEIREIIMRSKNLVSFQSRIEEFKTHAVQRFQGQGETIVAENSPMDYLAMTDYVLHKTSAWSLETARMLDQAIKDKFPHAPTGVYKKWIDFFTYLQREKVLKEEQIENEKRKLQCQQPASSSGSGSSATGTSTSTSHRRNAKRGSLHKRGGTFSSAFYRADPRGTGARTLQTLPAGSGGDMSAWPTVNDLDMSLWPSTTLQRRITRGAARSGPHAPHAPCCPIKNHQQKKTVKRSATKIKPPPATKPRQPAHQPKAKAPSPSKQVVKRPASRPRREVGKPAQRKRITPAKKPRVVPRPARKPRGKPRARRSW